MPDVFSDVLEFHREMAPHLIGSVPAVPEAGSARLRLRLLAEEYEELERAIFAGHLPGIADGIADLIYVAIGTAIGYGIDMRPVWEAVHRANMAKAGGPVRDDGKRGRPPGWQHPDIASILESQGPLDAHHEDDLVDAGIRGDGG